MVAAVALARTNRPSHPRNETAAPAAPALDAVRSGRAVLDRGSQGPAVSEVQRQLNANGANLEVDGKFGPRTQMAVRQFQAQRGLRVDGVVGTRTVGALDQGVERQDPARNGTATGRPENNRAPTAEEQRNAPEGSVRAGDLARTQGSPAFAPTQGRVTGRFAQTSEGRERQAEQILRANGQWPPQENRNLVIQIDQDSPKARDGRGEIDRFRTSYTGQTSVFRYENGRLNEVGGPFRSASHPNMVGGTGFTDVNGDGRNDIATMRTGTYQYEGRTIHSRGRDRFNPRGGASFPVARDTNLNGIIDPNEASRRYMGTALQWHPGNQNGPSSAGCQTMQPADFERFERLLENSGRRDGFTYVLVRRPNDRTGANPF